MCCVLLYADQDLLRMVAIACPIPFPTGCFVAPLDPFRPHPEFTLCVLAYGAESMRFILGMAIVSCLSSTLSEVAGFGASVSLKSGPSDCISSSLTWAMVWPKSFCLKLGLLATLRCTLTSANRLDPAWSLDLCCRCLWCLCFLWCSPLGANSFTYFKLPEHELPLWSSKCASLSRACLSFSSVLFFCATSSMWRSYKTNTN